MSDASAVPEAAPLPASVEAPKAEALLVRTPQQESRSITDAFLAEETVKWGLAGENAPQTPAAGYFESIIRISSVKPGERLANPLTITGSLKYLNSGNGAYFDPRGISIQAIVGRDPTGLYLCQAEFGEVAIPEDAFKRMLAQSEAPALIAHAGALGAVVQADLTGNVGSLTVETMAAQARGAKLVPRDTLIASLKNVLPPDKVALVETTLAGEYASPRMVAEALSASGFLSQPEQHYARLIGHLKTQIAQNPNATPQEIANSEAVITQLEVKRDEATAQAEQLTANGANQTEMISVAFDQMTPEEYAGFMDALESGNAEAAIQNLIDKLPEEQQSEWQGKLKGLAGAGGTALLIALFLLITESSKQ